MSDKSSKIYVDLTSLFDLRHSALFHILGHDKSLEIAASEDYNLRETDRFDQIDPELLSAYLQTDDPRIIQSAPLSYIHVLIASKISTIEKRNAFAAETSFPEVVLNIFPFRIDRAKHDTLQNAVFIKVGGNCKVTIIHEDPKKITPGFLKHNSFIAAFMYDFSSWIEMHAKAVENGDLMDVLMYFASLYKEAPSKEDLKTIKELGFPDVFSYTEYLFIGKMKLSFLPVFMYSSVVTATLFLDANKDIFKDEEMDLPVKDFQL